MTHRLQVAVALLAAAGMAAIGWSSTVRADTTGHGGTTVTQSRPPSTPDAPPASPPITTEPWSGSNGGGHK